MTVEEDIIYIDGILQSGDSVPIYGIDAELIQI